MDLSVPTAVTPNADPAQVEHLLAQARAGAMELGPLITHASALQAGGMAEAAALLYQNWLMGAADAAANGKPSPHQHVACYN